MGRRQHWNDLETVLGRVMGEPSGTAMTPAGDSTLAPVAQVGAPVLEPLPPAPNTPAGRFYRWLEAEELLVTTLLESMTARWRPLSCFVEVNFEHPELGPAGAVVLTAVTIDVNPLKRRARRAMVIPFLEMAPYLPRWERGETILVSVPEMPEPLARRYAATPLVWSLNVPVHVEGTWVGLVGATADDRGFSETAITAFEALARVLMRDFTAYEAWSNFHQAVGDEPRLRLLSD
jgi:hypothetical protein